MKKRLQSKVKISLAFVTIVLLLALAGCGSQTPQNSGNTPDTNDKAQQETKDKAQEKTAQETIRVPYYTPKAGGTAYVAGATIAEAVSKYAPNIKMNAEATNGSVPSVKLTGEKAEIGEPTIAQILSSNAAQALNGEKPFEKKYDLRGVVFNYGSELNLIVPKNSPIKSVADIKGKKISMNASGSGVSLLSMQMVKAHGVDEKDFSPVWLGSNEIVAAIKDGSIDGGFIGASIPVPAIVELASQKDIRLVSLDEQVVDNVVADSPFYYKGLIPGGTYKGVEEDAITIGYGVVCVTSAKTSDDIIYNMLKAIFEHKPELEAASPILKQMTLEDATKSITIPLHPGAEKYYKEKGVLK